LGQKVPGSKLGQPLIYCRSKVCSGQVRAHLYCHCHARALGFCSHNELDKNKIVVTLDQTSFTTSCLTISNQIYLLSILMDFLSSRKFIWISRFQRHSKCYIKYTFTFFKFQTYAFCAFAKLGIKILKYLG